MPRAVTLETHSTTKTGEQDKPQKSSLVEADRIANPIFLLFARNRYYFWRALGRYASKILQSVSRAVTSGLLELSLVSAPLATAHKRQDKLQL